MLRRLDLTSGSTDLAARTLLQQHTNAYQAKKKTGKKDVEIIYRMMNAHPTRYHCGNQIQVPLTAGL